MFGLNNLKPILNVTEATVSCPVMGCEKEVRRQRKKDNLQTASFLCHDHGIYISPSTFEYVVESENLLWAEAVDLALLDKIKQPGIKRENRIARDNSEDAVSWNVFRHLERQSLLNRFVDLVWDNPIAESPALIYWSYCQKSGAAWTELVDAAPRFGERVSQRSEPDLIIDDSKVLLFIENKFGSGNRTNGDPDNPKQYVTGCNNWFKQVFTGGTTFNEIAVDDRLFELMRLWLIGTWIADQAGKSFCLVNIVREGDNREADIENRFGEHLRPDDRRQFVRLTWERLHQQFVDGVNGTTSQRLGQYFKNKSLGYDNQSHLKKAFNVR